MGSSFIITDNAAQFTKPSFPGSKSLHFLDESLELEKGVFSGYRDVLVSNFPKKISNNNPVRHIAPTPQSITDLVTSLYQKCDDLFIILISSELNQNYALTEAIVKNLHGRADIHLIDSKTFSIGQGQLIQSAADLIDNGFTGSVIEERLRQDIPHVYTLLTTPNFSYLHKSGFIDIGQSVSSEMLSFQPIFNLDGGRLIPVEKVKSIRNVLEYFIEFIDEFDDLKSVSIIQPYPSFTNETKIIRQHIDEFYPGTIYTEHSINPHLASMIGPQGMAVVVNENTNP